MRFDPFAGRKIEAIVFSFDRPLQLDALLASLRRYWPWLECITVLYKTSDAVYEHAYREVFAEYPAVHALSEHDFRGQLIDRVGASSARWICLMVDDDVMVSEVGPAIVGRLVQGHVFSLRLGTHITTCQPLGNAPESPLDLRIEKAPDGGSFITWRWGDGFNDWTMPFSLDGNIVARKELLSRLRRVSFRNPNTLEDALGRSKRLYTGERGAAYATARLVNVPLNRVQDTEFVFPSMNINPRELLELWQHGRRLDWSSLEGKQWPSCHVEEMPSTTRR